MPAHPRTPPSWAARYGSGPEGGSVAVTIANYGDDLVEVPANLSLPDGTTISAFVTMEAGQTVDKTFTVPRVTQGGVGIVQIEDGKIAEDNVGSFHLPTIGASRVLVVDGDPGSYAHRVRPVYYLERGARPVGSAPRWTAGSSRTSPAPWSLGCPVPRRRRPSGRVHVQCCDPGPWANRLVEFVSGGGSLVISLGDNVSADRTNAVLAKLRCYHRRCARGCSGLSWRAGRAGRANGASRGRRSHLQPLRSWRVAGIPARALESPVFCRALQKGPMRCARSCRRRAGCRS